MYLFTINWLLAMLAIFIVSGFIILLFLDHMRRIASLFDGAKILFFLGIFKRFQRKIELKC